jgi:hypothetical protein
MDICINIKNYVFTFNILRLGVVPDLDLYCVEAVLQPKGFGEKYVFSRKLVQGVSRKTADAVVDAINQRDGISSKEEFTQIMKEAGTSKRVRFWNKTSGFSLVFKFFLLKCLCPLSSFLSGLYDDEDEDEKSGIYKEPEEGQINFDKAYGLREGTYKRVSRSVRRMAKREINNHHDDFGPPTAMA